MKTGPMGFAIRFRNDQVNSTAERLVSGVAEQCFGARVPAADDTFGVCLDCGACRHSRIIPLLAAATAGRPNRVASGSAYGLLLARREASGLA